MGVKKERVKDDRSYYLIHNAYKTKTTQPVAQVLLDVFLI